MTIADLNTLARLLCNTDTTSYTAANLLIAVNASYERLIGKIHAETMAGDWKFGDFNYTAFPSFTASMTNGTQSYDLQDWGTTDEEIVLAILGVEVLDNTGIWHPIEPITLEDIRRQGLAQSEFLKTNGRPIYYEKRDNLIVLYPAPDNGVSVTLTNGLRIFHLRTADKFTSAEVTTGTKEPGIPSPWHDIIAYEAAYLYAIANQLPNAALLKSEVDRKEKQMMSFISRRNQDNRPILTMKYEPHF